MLLKYLGWSAVYSGNYGLPSEMQRVTVAAHWGRIYFWGLLGLSAGAIVGTMLLLPAPDEGFSSGLGGTIRFLFAILIVVVGIAAGACFLTLLGHHL
jgi:hypothetical protein